MEFFAGFSIDKNSDIPIWVQLKQRLIYLVTSGAYKSGDQLPTVRELAAHLDINYHTVNKVYKDLKSSGLVEVQAGKGSFVAYLNSSHYILLTNDARMMAAEYADELLQLGMTAEEVVRVIANHMGIAITISTKEHSLSTKRNAS